VIFARIHTKGAKMAKKRVFSGIQPSGNLHIGNYFGAILTWVREQDDKENIFCIVDEHAITVPQNPKDLKKRILELAKIYIAAGIDPAQSSIFVQSSRPEHTELGWILNCFTYFGELVRMTQFKDKTKGKHFLTNQNLSVTVGLFDYPALMAADILLYDTDEVPVGEDQKQHVELTRDIAERVNKRLGKVFVVPQYYTIKEGTRIMSLQDPTKKMSKSDENENSRIEILDSPEIIRKKFAKAVTDSGSEIKYDKENKPGISNLLNILSVCTETPIAELEKKYEGVSYGDFKKEVAEAVIKLLQPFQEKYNQITDEEVIKVLKDGADKVAPIAQKTLKRVKETVGLGI
jgi:tryptophanyl-tRNA synthetase